MVRIERLQGENHSISAMFHRKFMCGKMTVVGCPKLGLVDYSEKLQEILHTNDIKFITIIRMEVSCDNGL